MVMVLEDNKKTGWVEQKIEKFSGWYVSRKRPRRLLGLARSDKIASHDGGGKNAQTELIAILKHFIQVEVKVAGSICFKTNHTTLFIAPIVSSPFHRIEVMDSEQNFNGNGWSFNNEEFSLTIFKKHDWSVEQGQTNGRY